MIQDIKVWDTNAEQLGDVVIASFAHENDAELFVKAKAKREGGFVSTLMVGTEWSNRYAVPLD